MSAAAAQLGTTQPTISRRLQLLERSMGLRLLQRSTHAMKLTEDGERCYERALNLLAEWESFEFDLRGANVEAGGSLRVVVPNAFGQGQLIGPLAEFMRRHPGITVEWLLYDRIADFIAHGIDCAIQVGEVTDPSVVAIRLAEVPRMLAIAPSLLARHTMPAHPRDLATMPWLAIPQFYRRDITLRNVVTGEVAEVTFQPRLSSDSLYALTNAAVEGVGLILGSAWLLQEHMENGRLLPLLPEWEAAPLPVSIIYPYARFYPARLRYFIETMREAMPAAVGSAARWT
ncbi:LysR family transcriptional regulator [Herbaspirillum sp. CF444]|uniref:LysR family transcriptional regulator n=1 Tax=Herbaspirillum sp. CF444 TaxID=1144319 RepID=UPI001ED93677|nr:LysR family transcriptional regulator [Herbaspirillum sp. CF444]